MKVKASARRFGLLEAVFDSCPDMITVSTLDGGVFIEVNDEFLRSSGYSRADAIGKSSLELDMWVDPEARMAFGSALAKEGKVRGFESLFRKKDGTQGRFQLSASLVDLEGEAGVVTFFRDVTEASKAEEELGKAAFLLERAEEMARIGSWEFDYATKSVVGSDGASRIYGVPRENLTVAAMEGVPLPEYRPLLDKARDDHILRGLPYDIEFKIRRKSDGAVLDIHSKALWDGANKRLFGIIRDITDEKKVQEGLKRALAEREALVTELLHRIGNTLQVVISLVELEASSGRVPSVQALAARLSRRVRTMALVHQSLAEADDLSRVEIDRFLPRIAEVLLERSPSAGRVKVECGIDDSRLVLDAAVPLGMIVGELVDNACSAAFPEGHGGSINLRARRCETDCFEVFVIDDGIGLPEGFDPDAPGNVGLLLARSLAEMQLKGRLELVGGQTPGCAWRLKFRDAAFQPRV